MKTLVLNVCAIAFVTLLLTGCNKNDTAIVGPITPIIIQGDWVVSSFTEPGENKTSDFNGYSFTFQPDGKLLAISGGVTKEGTWSENKSSGKLIINLGPKDNTNKPLGELTDDWRITAKSDTNISLTDDNATKNEVLVFSKN